MRHLRLIKNELSCELVVTSKFLSSRVLHLIYSSNLTSLTAKLGHQFCKHHLCSGCFMWIITILDKIFRPKKSLCL